MTVGSAQSRKDGGSLGSFHRVGNAESHVVDGSMNVPMGSNHDVIRHALESRLSVDSDDGPGMGLPSRERAQSDQPRGGGWQKPAR